MDGPSHVEVIGADLGAGSRVRGWIADLLELWTSERGIRYLIGGAQPPCGARAHA